MKEFVKLTVSLSMTCLIAATALAFIFMVTKEPIAQQHKLDTLKAVKQVLPAYDNDPLNDMKELTVNNRKVAVYVGKKSGKISGIALTTAGEGYGGLIQVMVGMNVTGDVSGIEILSNQETPGLGTKVNGETFKNQFKGKSLTSSKLVNGKLAVNKDGGDIVAITGATISSRGVTMAVNKALDIFKSNKNKILE